ncbi:MAG TPA: fumarylacetoacetate hydrolase family protein [Bryobacteraceae bacterium]|nr:fumarylacetoacetate hydrolase family protein [Bryobacteraceae bacterium]
MSTTRRELVSGLAAAALAAGAQSPAGVTRYVRFRRGSAISYGILEGETIRAIQGDLFGSHRQSGTSHKLGEVKLVYPCDPPKVLAVGLNYKSHLGNRKPPSQPELFYKPITCLQHPEEAIVIPAESKNTHYEGELVLVIGKRVRNATAEQARDAIFGVTCGNDVSERDWQGGANKDLQWWRAKGADTFGPCGPVIARGLNYGNLKLRTRLNGEVVQEQSTSDLLFDATAIVSFASRYVTLTPGDLIYTGTPGSTRAMKHGDVVEVDIEGIGVLRNRVTQATAS